MAARAPMYPPADVLCLHLIGDSHVGATSQAKLDRMTADVTAFCPTPTARIQVGDSTNDSLTAQDTAAQSFLSGLGGSYYTICGNHDIWNNTRTGLQWAAAWGYSALNYTVDFGTAVGIFLSPDTMIDYVRSGDNTMIGLSSATETFLDNALGATTKDCLVFCHAPLYNTVVGPTTGTQDLVWSSVENSFFVRDHVGFASSDGAIRTVLGNHTNARAWISGHTHSPPWAPGFVTPVTVGSHVLASINCSALYYQGRTLEWNDPLQSLYLSLTPGVKIDVRIRDHGAGLWSAVRGSRVLTVTF